MVTIILKRASPLVNIWFLHIYENHHPEILFPRSSNLFHRIGFNNANGDDK